VDGKSHPISFDNYLGRISINLTEGNYHVVGNFKNTPIRTIANILTVVSMAFLIKLWKRY
jgi:hypothetical protein